MPFDDSEQYQEFDPIVIGGPTNDYSVIAPMVSSRWVEFNVLSIATGDVTGATGVVISGNSKPSQPNWVGAVGTALDNDHVVHGLVFRLSQTTSQVPLTGWIRVTNSEKKVFIRIDTKDSDSAYVTLQFRARLIDKVPGPSHEVHPDHMHKLNQARSETTKQRLQEMGVPGYAEESEPEDMPVPRKKR
jgi:hypothetical protein